MGIELFPDFLVVKVIFGKNPFEMKVSRYNAMSLFS